MLTNTLINLEKLLGLRNNDIKTSTLLLKYDEGLMLEFGNLRPLGWHEYNMLWKYGELPFGYFIVTCPREVL